MSASAGALTAVREDALPHQVWVIVIYRIIQGYDRMGKAQRENWDKTVAVSEINSDRASLRFYHSISEAHSACERATIGHRLLVHLNLSRVRQACVVQEHELLKINTKVIMNDILLAAPNHDYGKKILGYYLERDFYKTKLPNALITRAQLEAVLPFPLEILPIIIQYSVRVPRADSPDPLDWLEDPLALVATDKQVKLHSMVGSLLWSSSQLSKREEQDGLFDIVMTIDSHLRLSSDEKVRRPEDISGAGAAASAVTTAVASTTATTAATSVAPKAAEAKADVATKQATTSSPNGVAQFITSCSGWIASDPNFPVKSDIVKKRLEAFSLCFFRPPQEPVTCATTVAGRPPAKTQAVKSILR